MLQLYFYNVIVPQSTKVRCSWLKKSKSLKLQLCWYKMMCKQWQVMEHCIPTQLICHPQLNILTWYYRTPPMGNGCGKHGAMNSIYWQIMQYMKAWALLFPLQADWPYFSATPYSCHFGSRYMYFNRVTTEAKILQLLQRGADIWVKFCSCPEYWVHPVCC